MIYKSSLQAPVGLLVIYSFIINSIYLLEILYIIYNAYKYVKYVDTQPVSGQFYTLSIPVRTY